MSVLPSQQRCGVALRAGRRLSRLLVVAASVVTGLVVTAAPGAAAASLAFRVTGFGYGHGQGMGQWGAFGYSSEYGWDYQQVLAHYYGGTVLGKLQGPEPDVTVVISELSGHPTIATAAPGGNLVATTAAGPSYRAAAFLVRWAGGASTLFAGQGCGGPWSVVVAGAGPVTIASAGGGGGTSAGAGGPQVTLCLPGLGQRTYQGWIVAPQPGRTENIVGLEDYVDGVVPAESPVSWEQNGGQAALEAQAVAARSFALAYTAAAGAICDTTYCQVYAGLPSQWGQTADAQVAATAGQVLYCARGTACGPVGSVAMAEYSASTGGYTAGGAFPAVPDLGDAVPANPVHSWTVTLSAAAVARRFPSVGDVTSVQVVERNGLGQIGGRVLLVRISGTTGAETVTGARFAAALGLRSDWFQVGAGTGAPPAATTTSPPPAATTTRPPAATSTRPPGVTTTAPATTTTRPVPPAATTRPAAPTTAPPAPATTTTSVVGGAPAPTAPASPGPAGPVTPSARQGTSYWVADSAGDIRAFGRAPYYGTARGTALAGSLVSMAAMPGKGGYWVVGSRGGVLAFGHARWYGSASHDLLRAPVVAIVAMPGGRGYWLATRDGTVYAFGTAELYGSLEGAPGPRRVVGMAATPDGHGYWLVTAHGSVFPFGDAAYFGSGPPLAPGRQVTGIVPSADGRGYYLVASDGGVFAYGDAPFVGSLPGVRVRARVVSVAPAPRGGYYVLAADGRVYSFEQGRGPAGPTGPTGWPRPAGPSVLTAWRP